MNESNTIEVKRRDGPLRGEISNNSGSNNNLSSLGSPSDSGEEARPRKLFVPNEHSPERGDSDQKHYKVKNNNNKFLENSNDAEQITFV